MGHFGDVQLPKSAVNVALPAFAAMQHAAALCCGSTGHAAIASHSQQQTLHTQVNETDTVPLHRACSAYYAVSASNTHAHPFNGFFSGTTRVSRYQKGKTNVDFAEARDSEWQWHQLGHMQVCTSLQTDNHASTPPLIFTGRIPFLPPNQQHQSTEGLQSVPVMIMRSCSSTDSKRAHCCCHLPNNCGSHQMFPVLYKWPSICYVTLKNCYNKKAKIDHIFVLTGQS